MITREHALAYGGSNSHNAMKRGNRGGHGSHSGQADAAPVSPFHSNRYAERNTTDSPARRRLRNSKKITQGEEVEVSKTQLCGTRRTPGHHRAGMYRR